MSLMNDIREEIRGAAETPRAERSEAPARKRNLLWLNFGILLKGAGEDGTDLFVGLPYGLPFDDMKPQEARGSSEAWIKLVQAKNRLLERMQKAGAKLSPGESSIISYDDETGFAVQMHRVAEPKSVGNANNNDYIAAIEAAFNR